MTKEKEDHQIEEKIDELTTTEVEYEHPSDTSSLRRVAEGIPFAAWFIIVNEFW